MRVEALKLERPSWGKDEDRLVGAIVLKDVNGAKIEVPLTPAAVSRLIASISTEVVSTFKTTAAQLPAALKRAEDEGYLLENDGVISLEK